MQYAVEFRPAKGTDFDLRLGLAMNVLILAIESQRDSADDYRRGALAASPRPPLPVFETTRYDLRRRACAH